MTISVVQSMTARSNDNYSGNFASNVTAGNTLVMAVSGQQSGGAYSTASPKFNNATVPGTTQPLADTLVAGGVICGSVYMLPNVAGGATAASVTVNNFAINSPIGMIVYEVAGLGANPTLDKTALNFGHESVAGPYGSGLTPAITSANEFILGFYVQDNAWVSGPNEAGWTGPVQVSAGVVTQTWYQVATSSGGTYSLTAMLGASGTDWLASVVTIAATAPAAAPHLGGGKSMLGRSMRWADL